VVVHVNSFAPKAVEPMGAPTGRVPESSGNGNRWYGTDGSMAVAVVRIVRVLYEPRAAEK
jgi:hypothetical protein